MSLKHLFLIPLLYLAANASAQNLSSDELFKQARQAAFEQKDYPKAIQLSKQALTQSPDYADIQIFLGRLYTWYKRPDSARVIFKSVISKHPDLQDGVFAYASLEYWNDNYADALDIADKGLQYHAQSVDLLLLKAKILNAMRDYKMAAQTLNSLLKVEPSNTAARALSAQVRDNVALNKVSVSYDFINFDKQFNVPWHLASIDYTRQTSLGSVTARLNYANRFSTGGTQIEIDAYPHISPTFYAYLSGGYSNQIGVFPHYRGGFSLYANLPASFEAEGGFRYLTFGSSTWIYTASLGKYYKNWWFNFRTFLTPSNSSVSQSYSLHTRYYFGGADDYFTLGLGTGVSPDDPRNNVLLNTGNIYKLHSNNISLGYRHAFKTFNVIYFNASLDNQEYQQHVKGNQFDFGVGYQRRF